MAQSLLTRHEVPAPSPMQCSKHLNLALLMEAAGWARLPENIKKRFDVAHPNAAYKGHMDLHCSLIGQFYACLVRCLGNPLPNINAKGLAVTVRVQGDGQGNVVWERVLGETPRAPIVRTTKRSSPDGQLVEVTPGGLAMVLDVFEEDGALIFQSRSFFWSLGPIAIPIPHWLTAGHCRVTHTDLNAGSFHFALSIRHPLWGETFRQTGIFTDACENPPPKA